MESTDKKANEVVDFSIAMNDHVIFLSKLDKFIKDLVWVGFFLKPVAKWNSILILILNKI